MRSVLMGLLLATIATPGLAQWEPTPDVLRIEGQGDGTWLITCQLQDRKGQPITKEIGGRNKRREQLSLVDARGGQCAYQAAADKPLVIAIKGGLYACTLPAPANMKRRGCEQEMAAGSSGKFDIRRLD